MALAANADVPASTLEHVPRYLEIAEQLQREIAEGQWPVGEQLEPEQVLATRFKVSRFTIREAMSRLEEKGMISRQRRRGTVVLRDRPAQVMVQKLRSMDELLQYSPQTRLGVRRTTIIEADIALASLLQCPVGTRWARIETVRTESGRPPVCWSDIYVPEKYAGIAAQIGQSGTPTFRLVESHFGVFATDITAELFAGALSQEKAAALDVEPGSAAFIIVRRYRDSEGRAFEVSVSEHPAGRFSYSIDLSRTQESEAKHA